MVIYCILCIFAIYGVMHICVDIFFQIEFKNVNVLFKVKDIDNVECLLKMMRYKLWYFEKIECEVENLKETDDSVINMLEEDYGVRFIAK